MTARARRHAFVALALLLAILSGAPRAVAQVSADARPGSVPVRWTGRVVDVEGAPLADARVLFVPDGASLTADGSTMPRAVNWSEMLVEAPLLEEPPLDELPSVLTDDEGRYALDAFWVRRGRGQSAVLREGPERVTLLVCKDGYAPTSLCPQQPAAREVALADITLPAARVVTGRVVDEAGVALQHVRVRSASSSSSVLHVALHCATTDVDGRFALEVGVDEVTRRLGVDPWVEFVFERSDRVPRRVRVRVADDGDFGDVVLERGHVLAGVVLDPRGRPVSDAVVFAPRRAFADYGLGDCESFPFEEGDDPIAFELAARHDEGSKETRSGVDGRFRLAGLVLEQDTLYVDAPGFEPLRLLRVPAEAHELTLVLRDEARLEITVVHAGSGTPVEGAHLAAARCARSSADFITLESSMPREVDVGEGGRFVVHQVGTVGTLVSVSAPGCAPQEFVAPGVAVGTHTPLEIAMLPEARITGRVLDDFDRPVPGADVEVRRVWGFIPGPVREIARTSTAADGSFSLDGLPAGEATVVLAGSRWPSARADVRLVSGEVEQVVLVDGDR